MRHRDTRVPPHSHPHLFSHLLTHYAGLPHTIPKQGDNVFETLESLVRKSTNMRQLTPAGQVHKV